MSNKKCIILIDGSNFYFKLRDLELNNLLKFNFSTFSEFLSDGSDILYMTYYIGSVKTDGTEHTKKLHDNQQKLLVILKNLGLRYKLGYLLKNDGLIHEKGVDVNIAIDMVIAAYEKNCKQIILVSSDTDLLPAVKIARKKGLDVKYVGFSHKPSLAMIAQCSSSKLLEKSDLQKFIS